MQGFIEERCLAYLSMANMSTTAASDSSSSFGNGQTTLLERWKATRQHYPLADYACTMWSHHTEAAGMTEKLTPYILFATESPASELSLWETWITALRADTWNHQLLLAIDVCKAAIRSPRVPAWAIGFWARRQARRKAIWSASMDIDLSGQSTEQLPFSAGFPDTPFASGKCNEIQFWIAIMLIEIAWQRSCSTDVEGQDNDLRRIQASPATARKPPFESLQRHIGEVP